MKKTFAKRSISFASLLVSFMLIFFLISCTADLGQFDMRGNYEDYYESFGDVIGIYDDNSNAKEASYDFKDSIFNDYIVSNLKWENDNDKVEFREYCYIIIPFTKAMKIESLALYVCKDSSISTNINLEFSAYYYEDSTNVPTNIKLLTSPDTRIVEKDDGNGNMVQVEEEIEYDDPLKKDRIAYSNIIATNNFDGFIMDNFIQVNDVDYVSNKCLNVKENSYLYIRCENNSGLNNMTSCSFSFMNLLVRKV